MVFMGLLCGCGLLGLAAGQRPAIIADDSGLKVQVPSDTSGLSVEFVSSSGVVVDRVRVLTENDLASLTEDFQQKIDALNQSKTDLTTTNELVDQISGAIVAIGRLELQSNLSSAIDQGQANCFSQGLLYNSTSQQCTRIVSCGASVSPSPATVGRLATNCGGFHFYNDNCNVVCPAGYTGSATNAVCSLDGVWRVPGNSGTQPCDDVNECNGQNNCTQTCSNIDGSYTCGCNAGYALADDGYTCEQLAPQATLFSFNSNNPRAVQTYTVPAGVRSLRVRLWGSGGLPGLRYGNNGSDGGAGAYAEGIIPTSPGFRYYVVVGGPGSGFGIPAAQATQSSANGGLVHVFGGGLVGIFNSSVIDIEHSVAIAGSGGAGGESNYNTRGGGAGGYVGQNARVRDGLPDSTLNCVGKGGGSDRGGLPAGIEGAGRLSGAGGPLRAGVNGNYGFGGGAGYYGGSGGGHCPNICGCGGGGGSSFMLSTATGVTYRTGGGSPSAQAGRIIVTTVLQ